MTTQTIIKAVRNGLISISDAQIQELTRSQQKLSKLKFVGFIGHMGAGKDYVADYLAKTLERKCEVVKFATKLNILVASILGVDDLSLFQDRTWKDKEQFVWNTPDINGDYNALRSARDIQKIVATIMREINPDIWLDLLMKECNNPDTLYIISDLRFQNEFQFVQENNGVVVFIENLQAAQKQHRKEYKDGKHQPHASECFTWSLYYEDQMADYRLLNNDYSDPKPLQDLVTFIESV